MPVTPAHAAAAWPLRKIAPRLPLSALVIGTMSPDYEYFLRLAPTTRVAHTAAGLLYFCVPVSLAVWWLFRRVVRPAILGLMPPGLASALGPPSTSWPLAVVAVALGAVSHVFWDGFTHHNDWAVNTWPVLRTVPFPSLLSLPWYKWLQYASSMIGALGIAVWASAWIASQPDSARAWPTPQRARAILVISLVALVTIAGGVANTLIVPRHTIPISTGRFAVGAMLACVLSVVVWATIERASRRDAAAL